MELQVLLISISFLTQSIAACIAEVEGAVEGELVQAE